MSRTPLLCSQESTKKKEGCRTYLNKLKSEAAERSTEPKLIFTSAHEKIVHSIFFTICSQPNTDFSKISIFYFAHVIVSSASSMCAE